MGSMIWSGVPQPWLGRSWKRPRLSALLASPRSGRLTSWDSCIAAARAMIHPRTGTPVAMPVLMMVAALWTCSVSQVMSGVCMLAGVFSDGATLGAAPPPLLPVQVESSPPKKNATTPAPMMAFIGHHRCSVWTIRQCVFRAFRAPLGMKKGRAGARRLRRYSGCSGRQAGQGPWVTGGARPGRSPGWGLGPWLVGDQDGGEGAEEQEWPVRHRVGGTDAAVGEHEHDVPGGEQGAGKGGVHDRAEAVVAQAQADRWGELGVPRPEAGAGQQDQQQVEDGQAGGGEHRPQQRRGAGSGEGAGGQRGEGAERGGAGQCVG